MDLRFERIFQMRFLHCQILNIPFYWLVEMVARSGSESSSSVIKLDTVRRIAELVTFSYDIELMLSV